MPYAENVFLNVPFDRRYKPLLDAIVFAVHDCGFRARSALEESNSDTIRVQKIQSLIGDCKFGIHDISRAGIDANTGLARFNMPLELGMFLGAARYGAGRHTSKRCLILDVELYRYRSFCSDISGQDIAAHGSTREGAIRAVRNWLSAHRPSTNTPGAMVMTERYVAFRRQLRVQAQGARLTLGDMTFADYAKLVVGWLETNPW